MSKCQPLVLNKQLINKMETQKISKNQFKKTERKLKRKLGQGISVLTKSEECEFETLKSEQPTRHLLAFHFGNGDEEDQERLSVQFPQAKTYIFPGMSYCCIEFATPEEATAIMETATEVSPAFFIEVEDKPMFLIYANITEINDLKVYEKKLGFEDSQEEIKIDGYQLKKEWLTADEETEILDWVKSENRWIKLMDRRTQFYGFSYFSTTSQRIDRNEKLEPIPEKLQALTKRAGLEVAGSEDYFNQISLNDYLSGQGIAYHVDSHSSFDSHIATLSLNSTTNMSFKNEEGEEQHLYLPQRSLLELNEEIRHAYMHSIPRRKYDKIAGAIKSRRSRVSLTFRRVRDTPCSCQWSRMCDSQNKEISVVENLLDGEGEDISSQIQDTSEVPTDMEKKHVYDVYEKIAPHFSNTRYKPWGRVEEYLNTLAPGSLNLDVGCGNGKYLEINKENIMSIGTDRSFNLVGISKERDQSTQAFVADSLKLSLRDNMFDSIISIAVIHHFSNDDLRLKAIRELTRVCRPGGTILIYVWAFEQHRKFAAQDVFVPWHLGDAYEEGSAKLVIKDGEKHKNISQLPDESQKGKESGKEGLIETAIKDESKQSTIYHRYYHVFKQGELEKLVSQVENLKIKESFYDHANWCVIAEKLPTHKD